ncbi:hypothetical protein Aph01nite_73830 [Acrocarpospora phusangensis]|uniref:Uncharacterized protein n=1 Tax=Acrocarpospora phusangensis TaxID=1070424 RepID=A0A919USV7_9ACTN|nr:hypothetical protein [Acrocarpospora phusangensis]GIH29073.1 hypothetical protein Aph01nite_73830 [Acrocarpospora phusangensis]
MTPDEIRELEARLMWRPASQVPAGPALRLISAYKTLADQHEDTVRQLAGATAVVGHIRTLTGGGGLPAEWALPWQLRAERAEGDLAELKAVQSEAGVAALRERVDRAERRLAAILAHRPGWQRELSYAAQRVEQRGLLHDEKAVAILTQVLAAVDAAMSEGA